MHQAILRWAGITPDAPALTDAHGTWSYRQFRDAVAAAADFMAQRGVRAGDRVMLIGENGSALAAFIFAASTLDACAVLENARRAPQEVDRIRAHADPRLVIYLTRDSSDAAAHARQAEALTLDVPAFGEVAISHDRPEAAPDTVAGTRDDVVALIYTTGTTGAPKGVMVRHGGLMYLAATVRQLRAISARDRAYCVLPITHIMGLAIVLGGTLRAGAHLYLIAKFDAAECASMLANAHISMLQGAPAMFAKLLQFHHAHPFECPDLRFIATGGAPLDASLKTQCEAVFGVALHNGYGLTEGASLCFTRLDDPPPDSSVGRPLPGVSVRIVSPAGEHLPQGQVGELWVQAPQMMKGYFRDPALTRRVLTEDGWFNTEDLATLDAAGSVHIVGRTKDLIACNGFKVYPLEVEDALNEHPGIVHSAVVGRGTMGSEDVIAFVELADGDAPFDLDLLRKIFAERISPYKKPREIYAMASLPSSPNGKVLKSQLRSMLADGKTEELTRIL
ncbi:class I adenylate-forming enzyme family protein [Bordetella genomosp. 10]|nr:class I adenylate-forming enzyme family protein [Bordetella genomosp. 10]